MKILWFILFSVNILFANYLIVKDASVILLINGKNIELKKDSNITLEENTIVCFLKGNGQVMINNNVPLDNATKKCYHLGIHDYIPFEDFMLTTDKNDIDLEGSYKSKSSPILNAFEETDSSALDQSDSEKKHNQVFYEKGKHTIVDILYGTDRKIDTEEDWEDYYTGDRDKLQFGIAQVSIPKKHKFGEMERPNKYLFWQKEKIGEHVVVVKLEDINKKEFSKFLETKLNNVEEKDILIFIHGFNVTFASAIRRTAQLSYDLKFKGVPMTYSWPSAGETSEYMKDESSVQYTTPHLVAFLKEVIDHRGEANIHIIGHSMGTRALTNAIKEISFVYPDKHVFKNIILAAPDIDKDVFAVNLFPYIKKTTDQITLYASSDDAALKLSKTLHGGKRIGQGGDEIFVFEGLVTVDATGIDTSFLGHSYFAEKEIIVKDLKEVIIKSLPPTQRLSLIEKIKAKLAYWKFKIEE